MIKVLNGADRPEVADIYLRGKIIALLTNASGVDKRGVPTYIKLNERYGVSVLLAPEHGIRSNLQDGGWGGDTHDSETGALVCNMKSKDNGKLYELLAKVDIAVYDIQDVGARFYTYLYNLTELMRHCAKLKIPVLILDRINPISGSVMQGVMLDETKYSSFIGEYSIPTRYGLTVGEFARYINAEKNIGCELYVIPCEGWKREMYADESDLLWVNPSPNIPSVNSAINYIGTCIFEATNLSEGRGTTRPFDIVGAPFVDALKLYDEMTSYKIDGVVFRRVYFTPQFNKHAGLVCEGLEMHITDRGAYEPLLTALYLFRHMRQYTEFTCRDNGLCLRFGTDFLLGEANVNDYIKQSRADVEKFKCAAAKYLMY